MVGACGKENNEKGVGDEQSALVQGLQQQISELRIQADELQQMLDSQTQINQNLQTDNDNLQNELKAAKDDNMTLVESLKERDK